MAASVGVVFYWLRSGDHPVVANQTKSRLPIEGNITVGSAISKIAQNHVISLTRYTMTAYDEASNRQLTNLSEILPSYSRIYLRIESKKLEESGDGGAGGGGQDGSKTDGVDGSEWDTQYDDGHRILAGPSSWQPSASSTLRAIPMEKVLAISNHVDFPLGLRKRTGAPTYGDGCALCGGPVVGPDAAPQAILECCGHSCCEECLTYVRDSELFAQFAVACAICGAATDAAIAAEALKVPPSDLSSSGAIKGEGGNGAAVKREREEDGGAVEIANLKGGPRPELSNKENAEACVAEGTVDSDDDFGESEPLRL